METNFLHITCDNLHICLLHIITTKRRCSFIEYSFQSVEMVPIKKNIHLKKIRISTGKNFCVHCLSQALVIMDLGMVICNL